jgi:hypothetical protein
MGAAGAGFDVQTSPCRRRPRLLPACRHRRARHDRQGLERLARSGARGTITESRLRRLDDGRYEDTPKKGLAFTVTAAQLVHRLDPRRFGRVRHAARGVVRTHLEACGFVVGVDAVLVA